MEIGVELQDICFKTATFSLHPMAKYVQLCEMCYKIAKCSLHPMAKCVELQEINFKTNMSLCRQEGAH